MKKIEVVVIIFVIVGTSTIFQSNNIFAKDFSMHEALSKGLIKLNLSSTGGHSENCMAVKVQNLGSNALNLYLEPGYILDNLDDHQQDIIVVKSLKIKLNPHQKIDTVAYGFCCQSHNASPKTGQKFRLGKMADTLMVKLCHYINNHKVNAGAAQSAVWTISNKHHLATIGQPKDTSMIELIKICNRNNNVALPWFYVGYSNIPGLVFSNIPCKVVLNFEYNKKSNKQLTISIYDQSGHKIKTLLANSFASPGLKSFHYDFDIVNWKKGVYTLKVKELNQEPISKTFEF